MRTIALLGLLLSIGVLPQSNKIRVYVFTQIDPGGLVDQAQKDRLDAARDIAGKLSSRRFVIVKTAEEADIRVEVLSRGSWEEIDWAGKTPPSRFQERSARVVEAVLLFGAQYRTDLRGVGFTLWTDAAWDCAKQIDRWTKDNRARILAARAK